MGDVSVVDLEPAARSASTAEGRSPALKAAMQFTTTDLLRLTVISRRFHRRFGSVTQLTRLSGLFGPLSSRKPGTMCSVRADPLVRSDIRVSTTVGRPVRRSASDPDFLLRKRSEVGRIDVGQGSNDSFESPVDIDERQVLIVG